MTEPHDHHVFLSYSRNDLAAADALRSQLERHGLSVFKDDESIRGSDEWLNRLQEAVDGCGAFVLLVGRAGVSRWISAETQVALSRYFGPHVDSERLPIFPILLGDTKPESLPAFLRLFQATTWDGSAALSVAVLDYIRDRRLRPVEEAVFEGCPFVGLDAFRIDQAQLFFGRQEETLEALACFDARPGTPTVRWLEISGNSGAGKSSLMNAGLLPLIDQGWLYPRTRIEHWRRIGPMMPGEHPVRMLAEKLTHLARACGENGAEMDEVSRRLDEGGDLALANWLRGRKKDDTAFLLVIDQFEELFTFATPEERSRFDRLLAAALDDDECPLYGVSTVRADFLDRYEELPGLTAVRNRRGRTWTLPPIGAEGLREIIGGPARLAGLDVSEVREAMVDQARNEPGALPLVEHALEWLWIRRQDDRLSGRLFVEQGGLAGILSGSADALLNGLGPDRERALELLFRLVNIDPDGRRHTRRRVSLAEALAAGGGGERGRRLLQRLAGERSPEQRSVHGPLRLITVETADNKQEDDGNAESESWVNLIHETLLRRQTDEAGKPGQPFWPTLWDYLEQNKERAARREKLLLLARDWSQRRGIRRLYGLSGSWQLMGFRGLAAPGSDEQRYLRWSAARASVFAVLTLLLSGIVAESLIWKTHHGLPVEAIWTRWAYWLGYSPPFPKVVEIPARRIDAATDSWPFGDAIPQPFYLGETEVTVDQYAVFAQATNRRVDDEDWEGGDRPVINVDWNDARDYARWLTAMTGAKCRLPTDAEWEHACRAGTGREYGVPAPDGSEAMEGANLANCLKCGSEWDGQQTAPVKSFEPSAWNLYDMHGNVFEWVANCGGQPPEQWSADLDDPDPNCRRAVRGGSWNHDADLARCSYRRKNNPVFRNNLLGFRVLCSSPIPDH